MGVLQRVVKPKTKRGKRCLEKREPKVTENVKTTLFLKGNHTSELAKECLNNINQFKKPYSVSLSGKNPVHPFEDATFVEKMSKKYDTSLFGFVSHSKKRPNNLILGRMFDHQLLDMVELGVEEFKTITSFDSEKIAEGMKPCLLFAGAKFVEDPDMIRVQNLLVDFFQKEKVKTLRLQGLEHVIMFTIKETPDGDIILMRSYKILLKKSGEAKPRVELVEIGPSMDLKVRRTHFASEDLFKKACKKPSQLKIKKRKNISRDAFGTRLGRVHMTKNDVNKLQTRKMKGLKKPLAERKKERALRKQALKKKASE